MTFIASILWIVVGLGLLGIARSFRADGNRITAAMVGIVGTVTLCMGLFL